MEYYKVIGLGRGSITAQGKARVSYTPGVWTRAPLWLANEGYHLTCFRGYEATDLFVSGNNLSLYEIWECEIRGIVETLPPMLSLVPLSVGLTEAAPYLATTLLKIRPPWPDGTVMAQEIMLTKLYYANLRYISP